jgi:preprotein translocase subunit SecF
MEFIKPGTHIDFLGKTKLFAIVSAALVLVSLLLIVVVKPNYGIDFKGGTNIIVRFNQEESAQNVTQVMLGMGFEDALVQSFGPTDSHEFLIQTNRISTITREQADHVRQALVAEFGEDDFSFSFNVESGDRIEVRLPLGAFDELPLDWQPPAGSTVDESALLLDGEAPSDADADVTPTPSATGEPAPLISVQRRYLQWLLADAGLDNPRVSQVGNPRQNRFLIRLQQIQSSVHEGFTERFGDAFAGVERVETVGPRVGQQLRNDGIKAVVLSLFFILVYIGLRFNMRFAPGAVACLFHDVVITLGILVILRVEVSLTILAALLTIVGYSLNDTIVVFDRIRENLGALRTKDLVTVVNQSINETLSRTILTSGTTMVAVLSIYFLGGGLIQSFALAMIIGILIGTYSSIYVASPIMIWLHNRLEARALAQREESRAAQRPAKARRSS